MCKTSTTIIYTTALHVLLYMLAALTDITVCIIIFTFYCGFHVVKTQCFTIIQQISLLVKSKFSRVIFHGVYFQSSSQQSYYNALIYARYYFFFVCSPYSS